MLENLFLSIKSNQAVILAWICMITAIMVGSSIGPMFKYMESHHITPCLAASWRCQCMVIFLLPAAFLERISISNISLTTNYNQNVSWLAKMPDLSYPLFVHIGIAGLAWAGNLLCWIIALQYTTTVQASVLTSTHPLMLVIYFYISGTSTVSLLEWIGVLLVFLGIIAAAFHAYIHDQLINIVTFSTHQASHHNSDPLVNNTNVPWYLEALGVILCLISSACEVIVLLNRKTLKKYVPLMQV